MMFICMQKINFIPPFFFEILQRYYKLAILGTLDMLGYDQYKWYYQFAERFDIYLHAKDYNYLKILIRAYNYKINRMTRSFIFFR